ncbi:putative secreted protein (Por secretion system target) [Lacibacter cauensis]|uniref:Putative secreted protein (Por secretion system target) n=1 Tax=Lacibacter cauensis TaxID=510947 RepID=A0A562SK35_9BACT|nr:T9SS type A sorting domain-containing protein [Lacibacter cauensis]TWI81615.1 putative secreted protein (Por secretion system target) [Lacibacter cauensis]
MTRNLIMSLVAVFATTAYTAQAQVPKLNSNPGASATIFLDFDGQSVNSPYWNGGTPFYATPSGLTSTQITTAFFQVAEDFNPFNINITTDSTVYFAAPINKRQRIIVTAYSSWYGSAGGVAYVESFRWGLEIPGFVFANLLGYNEKNIGEASSHESGHTLGLYHQSLYDANCNFIYEYNPGTGSGETSWAPIMGNSYGKTLTLWHKGSSYSCNTIQDDLAILSGSANGFGYKTDSVGNTYRQATAVPMVQSAPANNQPSTPGFTVSSQINTTSDVDIFKIDVTSTSRFQITAKGSAGTTTKPNVDIRMSILDSRGNVINTYNPPTSLDVTIDSTLNMGTYYLSVSNVSNQNVSNYGMLGDYSIAGAALPSTLPVQSMKLSGRAANNKHELSWNIVADEPIESIQIETSTNGNSFAAVQKVAGNSTGFDYTPAEKKTVFYRLLVTTASQLKYYSNVVALREVNNSTKFDVVTNIINKNEIALNSKGAYNWRVLDMGGRAVANGRTTTGYNVLQTGSLNSGMYLLQIIDGGEIVTQKIVKQ